MPQVPSVVRFSPVELFSSAMYTILIVPSSVAVPEKVIGLPGLHGDELAVPSAGRPSPAR